MHLSRPPGVGRLLSTESKRVRIFLPPLFWKLSYQPCPTHLVAAFLSPAAPERAAAVLARLADGRVAALEVAIVVDALAVEFPLALQPVGATVVFSLLTFEAFENAAFIPAVAFSGGGGSVAGDTGSDAEDDDEIFHGGSV